MTETADPAAQPPAPETETAHDWTEALDEAGRALVRHKGWQGPGDAVESYRQIESHFGADRAGNTVVLPRDEDGPEAYELLYDRLGRPKAPDHYTLPEMKSGLAPDRNLVEWSQQALHRAGLTQRQYEAVVAAYDEFMGGRIQGALEDQKQRFAEADRTLRSEWGADYEARMTLARRAARAVPRDVADIEGVIDGLAAAGRGEVGQIYRLFAWLGESLMEDRLTGEGAEGFDAGADQARHEIDALKLDAAFHKALLDPGHPGHRAATEKWHGLYQRAHGGADG